PYPLRAHLFSPRGKPTAAQQVLESFINLRNRKWGHFTGRTEEAFAEVLAPNRQRLEGELARMSWLADWQLVRPVKLEDGHVRTADLLNGRKRWPREALTLPLERRDLADNGGDVRADRDALLLAAPDGGRYLPLFPLTVFRLRV